MRILSLFLFFGITYANEDEVYTNQQLTELVGQLIHTNQQLTELVDQLMANQEDYTTQQPTELVDQLMANQKKMDGKIVANEADISGNKASIIANLDDLQVLTFTSFPRK